MPRSRRQTMRVLPLTPALREKVLGLAHGDSSRTA